ncbi:MAG: S8 family serine peptidase [Bacillota bacterium]
MGTSVSAGKPTNAPARQYLVALKAESISASALQAINDAGGTVVNRLDQVGGLVVETTDSTRFLKAMLANKEVKAVSPSIPMQLSLPQADADSASSGEGVSDPADYTWGVQRVTNNGEAWNIHAGTHDVVVAILDTGIDLSHPDLTPNIVPGSRSYVPGESVQDGHSHGTHVAGTVAANGGIKGVAPGVGLRAYKVLSDQGWGRDAWILQGILDAANDGVDVINMSLGGFAVNGVWWYTDPATGERFNLGNLDTATVVLYNRVIRYAINRNVTVVVAAGNESLDLAKRNAATEWLNWYLQELGYTEWEAQGATVFLPASIPGAVTISAHGGGWGTPDRLAFYSNYGLVDLAAPGGDAGPVPFAEPDWYKYLILSTVPTNTECVTARQLFNTCNYGWKGGTSMASPHAAGVAALIISEEYARTGAKPKPSQVVTRMQQSAEDIGKNGADAFFGKGLVNAYRAFTVK